MARLVKEEGQIFSCTECGNVVEIRIAGGGTLVCCGEPMALEASNATEDEDDGDFEDF